MNVQAPNLTTRTHRTPLLVGVIGLASAAIAAGVIAVSSGDDTSKPAATPAVQVDQNRVWDGSAILRGTDPTLKVAPAKVGASKSAGAPVERVWDGSPILRGTETAPVVRYHSGGPRFAPFGGPRNASSFPARNPEGFHGQP
jgi:hypothetical protein